VIRIAVLSWIILRQSVTKCKYVHMYLSNGNVDYSLIYRLGWEVRIGTLKIENLVYCYAARFTVIKV
jgi:hypothetical protein